ncbi:hypothetical protein UlMin_020952 [Ulmus minor]
MFKRGYCFVPLCCREEPPRNTKALNVIALSHIKTSPIYRLSFLFLEQKNPQVVPYRFLHLTLHSEKQHPHVRRYLYEGPLQFHNSYGIMLPEAIAIVMAPIDTSIGVSVIRNCQQRGFHPHDEAPDGNPIYEHCSHVYMNANLKFDVVNLRRV